ncbi:MAG TPA: hydroxymethylbilane synthase [Acidimicrobiales bacterium]|nr:hydroxymethylbilane synthase [Acidimicrobiales bacterium]
MSTLRLATRGSPLALLQCELVADALRMSNAGLQVEVVVIRTRGDESSLPLDQIGGQGVFVTEVEAAVADGRADAAVHSAKDMPSVMGERLVLAAVPPRGDPRDGLVGCALADLPPGGLVATGSARRRSQLANLRPDLMFTEVRGNMERRVRTGEDGSVSAVVVAVAAMDRLGWTSRLSDILDPMDVLPQAGQGALALQCRAGDTDTIRVLRTVDDDATHRAIRAERAVLAGLGGSCAVPVGAWAEPVADSSELRVHGLLASGDGRTVIRMTHTGEDPESVGGELARRLLVDGGGSGIDGFDADAPVQPGAFVAR